MLRRKLRRTFARSSFSGGLDSDVNRLFFPCVTGFTETEDSCVCTLGCKTRTAIPSAGSSFPGEIESDVGRIKGLGVPGFGAVEPVVSRIQ